MLHMDGGGELNLQIACQLAGNQYQPQELPGSVIAHLLRRVRRVIGVDGGGRGEASSRNGTIAMWLVGCQSMPHQRLVIFQVKALI